MNILLSKEFRTPHNTIPFSEIHIEDYEPAMMEGMRQENAAIQSIIDNPEEPTFDNVIAIGKTKEFTRPNTHTLYDALYQTQPNTVVRKDYLLMYLDEFAQANPDYAWTVTEMKEQLGGADDLLTKRDIHRMMNIKNSAYKELNRWLHNEHDLWIYSELKSADSGMELGNLSGIQYYPSEYNKNDLYYYVGSKSVAKDKVSRACTIRQVRAEREFPSPDLLFSMMAVDFVRNGQYTVVPFPIKYLREHFK